VKSGFDGTETASRKSYREQAKIIAEPAMSLTDVESLCAFARFCDPNGQVWSLVQESDHAEARRNFVRQTCDCPSGRLVGWDNATGKPIEPEYEPPPSGSSRIRSRLAPVPYGCAAACA
jgi:hypothetical protein